MWNRHGPLRTERSAPSERLPQTIRRPFLNVLQDPPIFRFGNTRPAKRIRSRFAPGSFASSAPTRMLRPGKTE
ncbi:MAG TPA: hypothetical protein DCW71_02470 [Alistipes sp.]|nr:hypothetical protein [Alistipes sp.]